MKNKLKKIRNLLAITLLIAFISCEKDNFSEESTTSKKGITVKEIKLNELFKDKRFKDLYNKLSPSSEFSKTSLEIENGFTIPDGNVKVIETDSVISYTMYIERDNQILLDKFENLVIQESKIDGLKLAYVLKYTPEEIKLAADNSFLFKGVIEKSNIISPLFNNVYSSSGGDCFIYVLMCDYGGKEHEAGTHCTVGHIYVKTVKVLCPVDEAPSAPNSGGDGTGTTSGGGSDGTGGSPNGDGGVLTTPVLGNFYVDGLQNSTDKTPCSELKMISNQDRDGIKQHISNMKTQINSYQEHGVEFHQNFSGVFNNTVKPSTNSYYNPSIQFMAGGDTYGAIHTHPTGAFAIFTFGDIYSFSTIYNNARESSKDQATLMLACKDKAGVKHVYALKVNDIIAFNTFVNNAINAASLDPNVGPSLADRIEAIDEKFANKYQYNDMNNQERAFLKFTNGAGISILEASDDLTNWSTLTLDSPTSPVNKTPCN